MKILSYGAIVAENKALNEKLHKLEQVTELLLKEVDVQRKVIGQLKLLSESRSNTAFTKPNQH